MAKVGYVSTPLSNLIKVHSKNYYIVLLPPQGYVRTTQVLYTLS